MNQANFSPGAQGANEETKMSSGGTTPVGLSTYNTFDLASTGPRGTAGARCPSLALN